MDIEKKYLKLIIFFREIGSLAYASVDNAEVKSQKSILTYAHILIAINLIFFSNEYRLIERYNAALTLLIFGLVVTLNLLFFLYHKNLYLVRNAFFGLYYCYLIVYHYVMGGYIGSVMYIYYGIPVLGGVQIFYKNNSVKNAWFILYIVTSIVLYFLEPTISKGVVLLPENLILLTFLNNFIFIASLVFLFTNYYTSIIRKEKQKSDVLIRNILPDSVVEELNNEGKSSPIMADMATVIFLDFVNFTGVTDSLTPQEIVTLLNVHFSSFDEIFSSQNVEKLKTIGDGYMAVGGVPEKNNTHPVNVAVAAMNILLYLENSNVGKTDAWRVRIGIHTGPVVAGIIGKTKFSYDVWGSSVNLSARLETAGEAEQINVSKEFVELTKDFFEFESRGMVEIKHGEKLEMFFLTDFKAEFRESRFKPNAKFYYQFETYAKTPF